MAVGLYNLKKALNVFGRSADDLVSLGIQETDLPDFSRSATDNRMMKSWTSSDLPKVGEKIGFMAKPQSPIAVSVFVTKGGVLKSSLTLNLARLAALHNIRTCVVGLDMQGDITTALGPELAPDENASLDDALDRMNALRGLGDVFAGDCTLEETLVATDLPSLFFIPETPELVALDQSLMSRNRREYWLRDQVIKPLKNKFDLILMDCSPNWNRLITNSLVASDVLISPVECKINNFRNLQTFRALIKEFREDMDVSFEHLFVPTRLAAGRKLSQEIFSWYLENLPNCSKAAIRESTQGEEATAMRVSVPEYAPTSIAAEETRELVMTLWASCANATKMKRDSDRNSLDMPFQSREINV